MATTGIAPADRLAYTVDDASTVSGISRSRLYELMSAGRIGWVMNGSRRLIPRSELERLLTPRDAA